MAQKSTPRVCLFVPSLLLLQILYAKQDVVGCRCRRRCPLRCTRIVRRYKVHLIPLLLFCFPVLPHHTASTPRESKYTDKYKGRKEPSLKGSSGKPVQDKKGKPTNSYVSLLVGPTGVMGVYTYGEFVYRECYYVCVVCRVSECNVPLVKAAV